MKPKAKMLAPVLAISIGPKGAGAPGAKPGAPAPSDSGYGPPGPDEMQAAQLLINAVRVGDPGKVVLAYRAIKEACQASYGGTSGSDEGE